MLSIFSHLFLQNLFRFVSLCFHIYLFIFPLSSILPFYNRKSCRKICIDICIFTIVQWKLYILCVVLCAPCNSVTCKSFSFKKAILLFDKLLKELFDRRSFFFHLFFVLSCAQERWRIYPTLILSSLCRCPLFTRAITFCLFTTHHIALQSLIKTCWK